MAKKISKKFSYIGENIRKIRQAKKISQAEFSSFFQLSRATVGAYEEGRSEPKIETLIMIANKFGISVDALLTKQLTVAEIYSFDRLNKKLDQVHIAKKKEQSAIGVPLVTANRSLDYIIRHADGRFIDELDKLPAPVDQVARAFEMKGNDMQNYGQGLNPGDLLFCTKVKWDRLARLRNRVILLVTGDEILCRRLSKSDNDKVELSADARGVGQLEVPKNKISECWLVKGYYTEKLNPPSGLEERMHHLEALVKKLEGY